MKLANVARVVTLVIVVLAAAPAWGQTFDWIDTAGGLFNDATNWTPAGGPPNSNSDRAEFNLNNTYTVTFQTPATNSNSIVDNGTVTFALSGRTYTLFSGDGLAVGGVAGQTGRVTLTNGTVSGDMDVGFTVGATGFVTIGSDAVFDAGSNAIQVGDTGVGTLTINSGGTFTGTGLHTVGEFGTSNGTLTVTGASSSFESGILTVGDAGIGDATISSGGSAHTQAATLGNVSTARGTLTVTGSGSLFKTNGQSLTVGESGDGDFTVTSGGTVTVAQTFLGNLASSSGSLSVSGSTSSFTSSSGTFVVGVAGTGSLEVTGGGTVNAVVSRIAASVGSTGSATVSGSGSTWNTASLAIGGQLAINGDKGTLTVADGGTVNVSGTTEIRSSSSSSLTIDGGTLVAGGTFARLGTLNLRNGTLHVKGIYDHGAAPAALIIDGAASGDLPTLRLSGNFAIQDVGAITVGNNNQGALVLDSGRVVNAGVTNISIGAGGLSRGTVSLSGNGTSLTTAGTLAIGGSGGTAGGSGVLNIGLGATAEAATLNLFPQGTININGGGLRMNTFNANGGTVNFTSGSVVLTGSSVDKVQLDALLGAGHVLGAGRTLRHDNVAGQLTLNAPLNINGGVFAGFNFTNNSTIQVMDGVVDMFNLTNYAGHLLTISGTGSVAAINTFTNNGTIQLNNNLVPVSSGALTNSGTIRGSGFMGNNLTNNAAGQVQVTSGNRLEFQGATNTNSGTISLIGGEAVFTGSVTNAASTGLISGRDGILRTGGITNNGSLAFTAGQMDVYGDITNNVGGRITISGGGIVTFYDDVTIAVGAANVHATAIGSSVSTVVFFGTYNGGLDGGGTAFMEGDHRPGNSPAVVSFGGDLAYGALSSLTIELGGTARGTQYDGVDVAGAAQLGGTLNVDLVDLGGGEFSPSSGDEFILLNANDGILGTFDQELIPALSGGLHFELEYAAQTVTLAAVGVLGDYNLNGKVDAADYTVWRNTRGQVGTGLVADGNHNHLVDMGDYTVWKTHYGNTLGSGAGASSTNSNVPEPAGVVLFAVAIMLALVVRPRA